MGCGGSKEVKQQPAKAKATATATATAKKASPKKAAVVTKAVSAAPAASAPPAEPKQAEPTKAEPTKAEPKQVEPTKAEPTKAEPKKAEPKKAEPKKAEAVKTQSEPKKTEAKKADPKASVKGEQAKSTDKSEPVQAAKPAAASKKDDDRSAPATKQTETTPAPSSGAAPAAAANGAPPAAERGAPNGTANGTTGAAPAAAETSASAKKKKEKKKNKAGESGAEEAAGASPTDEAKDAGGDGEMLSKDWKKRVRARDTDPITLGGATFILAERSVVGLDDPVYEHNRDIWEQIPRGFMHVFTTTDGGKTRSDAPIACGVGARKFGYANASYGYKSKIQRVVCLEKANGECAHIAAFEHEAVPYWIVGSKHVFMVYREGHFDADKALYDGSRYGVAIKIGVLWESVKAAMQKDAAVKFHRELTKQKITANGEAILPGHEHIVDYGGKSGLHIFSYTADTPSSAGLTAMSPREAEVFTKSFGLSFTESSGEMKFPSAQYRNYVDSVARRENSEGVVAYGLGADGKVVCLWKEKAYPYVMERFTREAICRGLVANRLLLRVKSRLSTQPPELRKYFAQWEEKRLPDLVQFAAYLKMIKRVKYTEPFDIQRQWVSLQEEFFTKYTPQQRAEYAEHVARGDRGSEAYVIMLIGPIGSGKSTVARTLFALLRQAMYSPHWVNQDECGSNRRNYLQAVKTAFANPSTTHLILDKMNIDFRNRKDYSELGIVPTTTVLFTHPEGNDAFKELAMRRLGNRAEKHRSLRTGSAEGAMTTEKLSGLFSSVIKDYNTDALAEEFGVVKVDVSLSLPGMIEVIWRALAESEPDLPALHHLELDAAIKSAIEYESWMSKVPTRPQFGALRIPNLSLVLQCIPSYAFNGKMLKTEFHVTLKYFGLEMDHEWFNVVAARIGEWTQACITEVVFNEKALALKVDGAFPCANEVPHITVALAHGVQGAYSNDMLADKTAVRLPLVMPILGEFVFM